MGLMKSVKLYLNVWKNTVRLTKTLRSALFFRDSCNNEALIYRSRLHDIMQIFIGANIRADTPCVYTALLYPDMFWITNKLRTNF